MGRTDSVNMVSGGRGHSWPGSVDPRVVAFVEGSAGDAAQRNVDAWRSTQLVPRILREAPEGPAGWTFGGQAYRAPIIIAPWGLQRLVHDKGEAATAAGAARAGVAMGLSSYSSVPFGEVGGEGPFLLQLTLHADRARTEQVMDAACAAGAAAIAVTLDNPQAPGEVNFRARVTSMMSASAYPDGPVEKATHADRRTLEWLVERAPVPVFGKGILSPDDADWLIALGFDGIIVSNHGGRQVAGVAPTAIVLSGIVDRVAGRVPVWVDSGIRTGEDVARAIAMGADAVLVGRPAARALATGGASGVERAMRTMCDELATAMTLLGCARLGDLGRDLLL